MSKNIELNRTFLTNRSPKVTDHIRSKKWYKDNINFIKDQRGVNHLNAEEFSPNELGQIAKILYLESPIVALKILKKKGIEINYNGFDQDDVDVTRSFFRFRTAFLGEYKLAFPVGLKEKLKGDWNKASQFDPGKYLNVKYSDYINNIIKYSFDISAIAATFHYTPEILSKSIYLLSSNSWGWIEYGADALSLAFAWGPSRFFEAEKQEKFKNIIIDHNSHDMYDSTAAILYYSFFGSGRFAKEATFRIGLMAPKLSKDFANMFSAISLTLRTYFNIYFHKSNNLADRFNGNPTFAKYLLKYWLIDGYCIKDLYPVRDYINHIIDKKYNLANLINQFHYEDFSYFSQILEPSYLAKVLCEMKEDDALKLFRNILDEDQKYDVLIALGKKELKYKLFETIESNDAAAIIDRMEKDLIIINSLQQVVEFLENIDENKAAEILIKLTKEKAFDILLPLIKEEHAYKILANVKSEVVLRKRFLDSFKPEMRSKFLEFISPEKAAKFLEANYLITWEGVNYRFLQIKSVREAIARMSPKSKALILGRMSSQDNKIDFLKANLVSSEAGIIGKIFEEYICEDGLRLLIKISSDLYGNDAIKWFGKQRISSIADADIVKFSSMPYAIQFIETFGMNWKQLCKLLEYYNEEEFKAYILNNHQIPYEGRSHNLHVGKILSLISPIKLIPLIEDYINDKLPNKISGLFPEQSDERHREIIKALPIRKMKMEYLKKMPIEYVKSIIGNMNKAEHVEIIKSMIDNGIIDEDEFEKYGGIELYNKLDIKDKLSIVDQEYESGQRVLYQLLLSKLFKQFSEDDLRANGSNIAKILNRYNASDIRFIMTIGGLIKLSDYVLNEVDDEKVAELCVNSASIIKLITIGWYKVFKIFNTLHIKKKDNIYKLFSAFDGQSKNDIIASEELNPEITAFILDSVETIDERLSLFKCLNPEKAAKTLLLLKDKKSIVEKIEKSTLKSILGCITNDDSRIQILQEFADEEENKAKILSVIPETWGSRKFKMEINAWFAFQNTFKIKTQEELLESENTSVLMNLAVDPKTDLNYRLQAMDKIKNIHISYDEASERLTVYSEEGEKQRMINQIPFKKYKLEELSLEDFYPGGKREPKEDDEYGYTFVITFLQDSPAAKYIDNLKDPDYQGFIIALLPYLYKSISTLGRDWVVESLFKPLGQIFSESFAKIEKNIFIDEVRKIETANLIEFMKKILSTLDGKEAKEIIEYMKLSLNYYFEILEANKRDRIILDAAMKPFHEALPLIIKHYPNGHLKAFEIFKNIYGEENQMKKLELFFDIFKESKESATALTIFGTNIELPYFNKYIGAYYGR